MTEFCKFCQSVCMRVCVGERERKDGGEESDLETDRSYGGAARLMGVVLRAIVSLHCL